MIRQAYVQFPKYGNQIKCQVPPCINDASMPDEEKLEDEEDEEKATRVKRAKQKGNSAHDS